MISSKPWLGTGLAAALLKLVQAKDSQTGITTLTISGDALKR